MKEGVPPVDKSNVAAQLNSSNLENIRLQRQIQDLKRAERNNAARDVAAAVIPAELPFYQHMLPVASASVQSAISSLSTARQMKKLERKGWSVVTITRSQPITKYTQK